MEFQEGLMRLIIQDAEETQYKSKKEKKKEKKIEKSAETDTPKRRWKLFHRSSTTIPTKAQSNQPPSEFLCPITGSLMAEPVIVSSGHSFERSCVEICKALDFIPTLSDASIPDFSSVIPNLALKSTIIGWCQKYSVNPPKPLDSNSAEEIVRTLMASQDQKPKANQMKSEDNEILTKEKESVQVMEPVTHNFNHAVPKVPRSPVHFQSKSLEFIETKVLSPPLPLATRPSCYSSSSSSSEIETLPITPEEEDEILTKLKSQHVFEVEEALVIMRKITRTREESRPHLCSYQLLSTLKSLIVSRYTGIQVNSVAALVNLSLDKTNKMKILRSGIVPPLIDVLKGGSKEAQEHAAGAIFSLALNDDNKTALGVLGALPPLLHLLRSESERTRHDAALSLYHLTLVQTNRTKLVKLGAVPNLLNMAKSGHMTTRILLILGNLGSCTEGRVALLDAGAVGSLVEMLKEGHSGSRESCVAVLYTLSYGGLRFKALAKTAGAVEALWKVETVGTERAKQKAKMIMEIMKGRGDDEEDEDVDWADLLESDSDSHSRLFVAGSKNNSSQF